MLILCPECTSKISNKAVFCPHCGYPINSMPKQEKIENKPHRQRKKHKKLPNGFGSIKKLSGNRTKPFAAYPPTTEFKLNGSPVTMPAIGYYEDWYEAFDALREYNKNPYNIESENITFAELYQLYYKDKYENNQKKTFSEASKNSTNAAFKNCSALHNHRFKDLRKSDLQRVIDQCTLKHASLELIVSLMKQMYKYAKENDIVEKDYSEFIQINIPDDDEKGVPFSQYELDILWKHKNQPYVGIILMMIYSGFRIKAFETIEINLKEGYFRGGVKTKAGKGRLVPIHHSIRIFVETFQPKDFKSALFRKNCFYPTLKSLGIDTSTSGSKHTPHDCRHTFSWLCDKYKVDDLSKHLLMGHSLGNDVEKSVYGHRTLEELKEEINKIQI